MNKQLTAIGYKPQQLIARHKAWRFINGHCLYVQEIHWGNTAGDRYSYTSLEADAKLLTEAQCRSFTRYMRDCDSVGFWA